MLKTRVITALFLFFIVGAVLFYLPPIAAILFFTLVAALAAWEWGGLMGQQNPARVMYAFVMLLFCWQFHIALPNLIPILLAVSTLFWILVVPFWFRFKWKMSGNDFFGYLLGGLVILPTWAAMIALHQKSPLLLLAAMALVWVADISAYFTGRTFGKNKLAPTISPGKTWEGVAGAAVGVLIYGGLVLSLTPLAGRVSANPFLLVLMLIVLTTVSVMGDLFESLLKRQAGIKDSSQLLPGHGGVLDRIDSLTSTLPVAALILYACS